MVVVVVVVDGGGGDDDGEGVVVVVVVVVVRMMMVLSLLLFGLISGLICCGPVKLEQPLTKQCEALEISLISSFLFIDFIYNRSPCTEPNKCEQYHQFHPPPLLIWFSILFPTEHGMCVHPPSVLAASCLSAAAYGILGSGWCQGAWFDRLHQITAIDVVSSMFDLSLIYFDKCCFNKKQLF